MKTVEQFFRYEFLTAPASYVFQDPGLLHTFKLPRGQRNHYLWLAAGAYLQATVDHHWFVFGSLKFKRKGTQAGEFNFCDASAAQTTTDIAEAPRFITRIRADGTGSCQPVIRYELGDTGTRTNLDMPCHCFAGDFDEVEYHVEKTWFARYDALAAVYFKALLGAKIVSL